jgi:hypothetical protein
MSEHTPSQAEGERYDEPDEQPGAGTDFDPPWTTPSQAEGEREDEPADETGAPEPPATGS